VWSYRINNTGQIVGIFETTSKFRGFVYTGGNFSAIDAPGGLIVTAPFDINDTGQIVGYFNTVTTGTHGFLYTGGSFSTLDVPDALYTIAHGINNAGQIVGTFVNAATLEQHGFLYTDGYFRVIDVPGSFYTYATDINDTGQIVGLFGDATGEHGFIATPVPPSFAAFTATLKLKFGRRINDAFDLKSRFTLGAGNNGITPLTEEVTLTLTGGKASFTTTIPAGAFTKDRKGRFTFTGQVDGVKLDVTLTPLGGQHYAFTAEGKHTDLRGIANPVTVTLTIGDDNGRTTVTAKLKDDHDKGGEGSLARHVTR
jgi:probable HAF family extracellular repeat protein